MDVTDLLTADRVIACLKAADKTRLLADFAGRAAGETGLSPAGIQQALATREALGSTGVGGGVAIPHARFAELGHFFGMFARLERRIDYDAIDEQPVDLVFLLLVPANAVSEHLQALACVSRRLRDPDIAARLRKADDAAALYAIMAEQSGQ